MKIADEIFFRGITVFFQTIGAKSSGKKRDSFRRKVFHERLTAYLSISSRPARDAFRFAMPSLINCILLLPSTSSI